MGTATYISTDTTTQGSWRGAYGADGYKIATVATSLPSDVSLSMSNANEYSGWNTSTTDVRAVQKLSPATDRMASCYYNSGTWTMTIGTNLSGGRRVGIYFLDWDASNGRVTNVVVKDNATNATLDSRSVTNYSNGLWYFWDITGTVRFEFTQAGVYNATISAVMFDAIPAAPPPAMMSASVDSRLPTTASQNYTFGVNEWQNISAITAADGNAAYVNNSSECGPPEEELTSYELRALTFGFSIPSNATITGITVEIGKWSDYESHVLDRVVSLVKNGTTQSTNKADSQYWISSMCETPPPSYYGGSSDLWGSTWTPADINGNNFGVAIEVNTGENTQTCEDYGYAFIDYVRVTVNYTIPLLSKTAGFFML